VHTDKNFVGGRISTGSFLLRFKCENHTTRFVACFKTAQQANCAVSPKTKKRRTTNDAKKTEGFEIVGMAAQINLAPPTFLPAATPGKPTKAAAKAAAAAPEIAAIAPLGGVPPDLTSRSLKLTLRCCGGFWRRAALPLPPLAKFAIMASCGWQRL
jgi:hypothetical protein